MDKNYILFIDSGIGGVSILDYLLSRDNNLNILYCADTKNFPYGIKDEQEIASFLLEIYGELKKRYSIVLVVIACNTASVSALAQLRRHVSIPVVGTVPAVKVASETTKDGSFGVIATNTTVKIDYLNNLIKDFAQGKKVYVRAAQKLVDSVETHYLQKTKNYGTEIEKTLREELSYFKNKNIDSLVLGCTHYSFLYEYIHGFFEGRVTIVDSRAGVSKRILYLMKNREHDPAPRKILYVTDKESLTKYTGFNNTLGIFSELLYLSPGKIRELSP